MKDFNEAETKISSASVKVMLSYDYSHFEVSMTLENDEGLTKKKIDEARKDCQRLADRAVEQYKIAKQKAVAQYGIDEALRLFEIYLDKHPEIVEAAKKELKGCNLSCWCAPDAPCHTRIIAQRAGLNVSFKPIKNK